MPVEFENNRHAAAYFGLFRLIKGPKYFEDLEEDEEKALITEAMEIDTIVRNSIAENSLNPKNIEAEIRKALLPRLYSLMGLDDAKKVIEQVIQITRIGLSKEGI